MKQTYILSKSTGKKKSKIFIPTFYQFKTDYIKDQIKVLTSQGTSVLYITPLLRTLISDMKNMVTKGNESLARTIKEKMDSNSRLLLKKGIEYSKVVEIKGQQFLRVNCDIEVVDENTINILNNSQWLNKKVI